MNIMLVLAHPNKNSFNHAIALRIREGLEAQGHIVSFHDLYEETFDPVLYGDERDLLDPLVRQHRAELAATEGLVIIHPNWWGQPPAMLKGWIDKIICEGVAYRFNTGDDGSGIPEGLLHIRSALVVNTSNTPEVRELSAFKDPLDTIWRSCVLAYCGVQEIRRKVFRVVAGSTNAQREKWLWEAERLALYIFR
ncbi:flavodoxin family protein [Paenibacillus contaminans]|uniref:Flavodoxin family protein n=1 Tax=Paenibacillus contaminans TaxID=450362 RepID=A0A329MVU3_9BACL|nr:flavodoxin family protein [Paenibacillus contaminans]